jgi:hypothetical protein
VPVRFARAVLIAPSGGGPAAGLRATGSWVVTPGAERPLEPDPGPEVLPGV